MGVSEQMYTDFKAILPDLQEAMQAGLSYSGDLFNRFIAYDITVNAIWILIALIAPVVCYVLVKKLDDIEPQIAIWMAVGLIAFVTLVCCGSNIVKDIFIPELRVIEVLSNNLNN